MTVNTGGTAQDTIERLQAKIKELETPVLPDDVAEMANNLRHDYKMSIGGSPSRRRKLEAADLLERQARENDSLKKSLREEIDHNESTEYLQKRLEQLESALTTLGEKGFMSFEDRAAFARAALQENE